MAAWCRSRRLAWMLASSVVCRWWVAAALLHAARAQVPRLRGQALDLLEWLRPEAVACVLRPVLLDADLIGMVDSATTLCMAHSSVDRVGLQAAAATQPEVLL